MGNCASVGDAEPKELCWQSQGGSRPSWKPEPGNLRARTTRKPPDPDGAQDHTLGNAAIESLPPEVLLQILARCPAGSFPRLKLVCRAWREQLQQSGELRQVRQRQARAEQWVVIASSEGDKEPPLLKLRAFHCQTKRWCAVRVPRELAHLGPGFALAALGHRLFLTGGTQGRWKQASSATWCFDLFSRGWQRMAPMGTPRSGHAMAAVCGKLVVAGGEVPGLDDFCLSEIYDPDTDKWHEVPQSALPAKQQEGWVVNSSLYVRHLPDRVYKITLPGDPKGLVPGIAGLPPCWQNSVTFQVSPYRKQLDPILAGMDHITSADGRVYGCMMSSHLSSIGVFNERSRAWHLLIGNGIEFHRIFERFDGMVCGGGCLFIVTKDNALLQVVMEDRGQGLAGPEWFLLSKGLKQVRYRWRKFACLEL